MENNYTLLKTKYEIRTEIYVSSSINVYSGKEIGPDNLVTIKIITKAGRDPNNIVRDHRIPIGLDHPNIIQILDFLEDENYAYIIYPYIENSICLVEYDQKLMIMSNKDNFCKMLQIMRQICDGIEYLHLNDIVHRDIKPDNIMITGEKIIIIDFDLAAKLTATDPQMGIDSDIVGTPIYIAPEIWQSKSNICYKKADIYSFGVLMYCMFNNCKFPYRSTKIEDIEYDIRNSRPKSSKTGNKKLDKLLMDILNKNPTSRPNITHIKSELDTLIGDLEFDQRFPENVFDKN